MMLPEDLRTGIDEIDSQHQTLFDCLDRLERAVTHEEKWTAVHYALEEVSDFARVHFAVEEALLRLHNYPGFDAHLAAHRDFVSQLEVVRQKSLHSEDVSGEMVEFLTYWLKNHIGKSDLEYVHHLRTAPVSIQQPVLAGKS